MKLNNKQIKIIIDELQEISNLNKEYQSLLSRLKHVNDNIIPDDLFKQIYLLLSTIRNRNLISETEQKKLRNTIVCFFGLSVGSHAALTWIMESRAQVVKISDPDNISASNLNRLRYGVKSIGKKKTTTLKEQLMDINPYMNVITSEETNSIDLFINSKPAVNVIIDAMDNLKAKVKVRQLARQHRLPVIMATDVGDNIIIDIERYDIDSTLDFFCGRIKKIEAINLDALTPIERRKLIFQLVGFEDNSEAMLRSLLDIGTRIPTWPQLGATATIAGGIITTIIKKIILGEKIISGRYHFSLDRLLVDDFLSAERIDERKSLIKKITR